MEGLLDSDGTGLRFNPTDESMLNEPKVNQFIQYSINSWKILGYTDDELWLTFKEDFEGWTEVTFDIAHPHVVRNLRDCLRENGVFVIKAHGFRITKSIAEVLKETNLHHWSQKEIEYQQRSKSNTKQTQPSTSIKTEMSIKEDVKAELLTSQDSTKTIIPSLSPLSVGYGITNLRKTFPISMKYKGYEDSLDITLEVFYENCNENGIGKDLLHNAVTIILDGDALEYYYTNIAPLRTTDFKTVIDELRKKFETEQQKRKDFSEWISLSLEKMIAENPDKPTMTCFELMLKRLEKLRFRLDQMYRTDKALRDRLLSAVEGVPECMLEIQVLCF